MASPLFGSALSYVTSHAWTHYEGLRQLTYGLLAARHFLRAISSPELANPQQCLCRASSLSAGLAAQLLGGSEGDGTQSTVRLVNTVAYGIGRGQGGADWHTDEISYRPVRRAAAGSRDDAGVSVWIPLQKLQGGTAGEGGGLAVVPLNIRSGGISRSAVVPVKLRGGGRRLFQIGMSAVRLGRG